MDNREFQFVMLGFMAAWIIIVVYVITIALRERRLRRELDRVRRMVETPAKRAEK
jgi:CcmD family protein